MSRFENVEFNIRASFQGIYDVKYVHDITKNHIIQVNFLDDKLFDAMIEVSRIFSNESPEEFIGRSMRSSRE